MAQDMPAAADRAAFDAYLDYPSLLKGGQVVANWLPDGRFWFVRDAPEATAIELFDPRTGMASPLFDVARTRNALRDAIGREPPYAGLPFEGFAQISPSEIGFAFEGRDYRLDTHAYSVAAEPKPAAAELFYANASRKGRATPRGFARPFHVPQYPPTAREMPSPDGRCFAGLEDHNIRLRYIVDGRAEAMTRDGEVGDAWDFPAYDPNGDPGGPMLGSPGDPWSPDGLRLFATRFDSRAVGRFIRLHYLKRFEEAEFFPMTRAGDALPTVTPYVIDTFARTAIGIDLPTADRYLAFIGWRSDARALYVAQFSRDLREATVYGCDPTSGATQTIFTERGDTFIRSVFDVIRGGSGCALLPDDQGFLWESERDGWKHLYRYDMDGKLVGQITSGQWPMLEMIAIDAADEWIYFTAHHDPARPYDVHLCRAPLGGGKVERLTESQGVHDIQMAPDCRCFVATVSDPAAPPRSEVRTVAGALLHRFAPMDISRLEAVGWTAPEEFSVKAADGETDLWGVIYKPRDFDPVRSYPVVEFIYGGPQVAVVTHRFFALGLYKPALAFALPQLGYVTVVLDARGTPGRSKAFQDVIFQDWRRPVTDDHAAALRNLAAARPWMDLGRVGICGHSWGGYGTVACLFDHPDLYRVGIASSPGFDPHAGFLYEPYFGGPPSIDNKAAYEDALLFTDAARLAGRLMIVAGSNDTGVWNDAVRMTHALIEAGKQHEFVMLPDEHHSFGSIHDAYFVEKLVGFLARHLDRTGSVG